MKPDAAAADQRRTPQAAPIAPGLPGSRTVATRSGRTEENLKWEAASEAPLDRAHRPDPRTGLLLERRSAGDLQIPLRRSWRSPSQWVAWARRCRIPTFVKLQKSITKHRTAILAAIEHGLSNGRVESMNTKIRLIARTTFGFKSPTPSSPSLCSPLAATNQCSPAGLNLRKSQES